MSNNGCAGSSGTESTLNELPLCESSDGLSEPTVSALDASAVTAEWLVSSQSSYSATPEASSRKRGKQDNDNEGTP